MKASKIFAGGSGYRVWILAFAICLVLLIALSKSWLQEQLSPATSENTEFSVSLSLPSKGQDNPPVLAYWICGTNGDGKRMLRLLRAIYHPRNQYLLQLDAESSDYERAELVLSVQSDGVFRAFGNVNVVGKSYAINQMGSSALAAMLHAAAVLLKLSTDWDWFINLSASDYPLVSQDDLLHAIASLPRDLNFIEYASNTEWKEKQNVNQIVIDPSLHLRKGNHLYYAVEKRTTPDAFNIFGGSPWLILTRAFLEYCVKGWDNLPRKLMMYFSNTASPLNFYFHTVLCNSPEFQNTTVNNNLRYNALHSSRNEEPGYGKMLASGAAFARPLEKEDEVLNEVDKNVLNRMPNGVAPGKWCSDQVMNITTGRSKADHEVSCSTWGNIDGVKSESYSTKLGSLLSNLANEGRSQTGPCHQ